MILPDDSRGVLVSDLTGDEDGPYVPAEMLTKDIPLPDDYAYPEPAISLEACEPRWGLGPNIGNRVQEGMLAVGEQFQRVGETFRGQSVAIRQFIESVRLAEGMMIDGPQLRYVYNHDSHECGNHCADDRSVPEQSGWTDPDHDVIGDIVDAAEAMRDNPDYRELVRDDLGVLRDLRSWNEDSNVRRVAESLGTQDWSDLGSGEMSEQDWDDAYEEAEVTE